MKISSLILQLATITMADLEKKVEQLSVSGPAIYVNDTKGVDESSATGAQDAPYKTPAFALYTHPDAQIKVFKAGVEGAEGTYEDISPSALKKAKKGVDGLVKKAEKAKQLEASKADREAAEAARLEAAKKITITEDKSLDKRKLIKIRDTTDNRGPRVKLFGWVHRLRTQKGVAFLVLRDGTGYLQCVLQGDLANAFQTQNLTLESSVAIYGTLKEVPEGARAPGGHELVVDFYEIIGLAPSGDDAITNKVQEGADPSYLLDYRYLTLRGETLSAVMKVRAAFLRCIRRVYDELGMTEITPPCMVQTQVEGGSTLFALDYYGEKAYLTQSSQLYLETVIPSVGDAYCIAESFRAERSHTRRHLSEYTHIEAELGFLDFETFLEHIEEVLCRTVDYVLADPVAGPLVQELNPGFKAPERPFMRMPYVDALEWLNEHSIPNEDGNKFTFGDDIAEAAERKMTDEIGKPIFLTRFPLEIKSFYMKKCADDPRVTESVDVLMPNVGEITGGSMRIDDLDELMAGFKREGIDTAPYDFFIDLRKYGTFPHGGYGLGTERILAWLCDRFTVRECSLYPRFTGRCKP